MFSLWEGGWLGVEDEEGVEDTLYFSPDQTRGLFSFLEDNKDVFS